MACYSCRSENVKAFTSEIDIRFPGRANLTKSVVASPKLLVCMDCGLADVLLSQDELRNLKEMYSSGSQEILADMECESSTKIPDSGVNEFYKKECQEKSSALTGERDCFSTSSPL